MSNNSQPVAVMLVAGAGAPVNTGSTLFAVREQAANAMANGKEARELLRMWMDSLSNEPRHEAETIRVGMLMSSVSAVISHLEQAIKED
ncbi:hypothetical protein [Lelliottia wanjuensis]|uniref:hypothetical protein n=1 Tax=Lelliottia wanjuensis TaxID=3050585 RepID=UPI00254E70DA|nr:hypothetical protein [Lelliottia sp. V104_15]MDK9605512.1 hypothetical protein [Lelliottia sp. V104_15]